MGYSFPDAIVTLSSAGSHPQDGLPLRAVHFNRMFVEITAIEAAIGPNPEGNLSDLKTRLAVAMNDNGTIKQEFCCEDDPSGNERGTLRYLQSKTETVTINPLNTAGAKPDVFVKLAYTAFEEPPVFIASWGRTDAQNYKNDMASHQIYALSEIGCNYDARDQTGQALNASSSEHLFWFAISRNLKVFEEDVAWGLPPNRTGS